MKRSDLIPEPEIHIGMKLEPFSLSNWERRKIVRTMISEYVCVLVKLRRKGFVKKTPDDRAVLTQHVKGMIRAFMHVIDTAHTVEVAGIHGGGHQLGLSPVNQCYVGGGTSCSGMDFHAQLLWRATVDGKELVVLQPPGSVAHCFSDHAMRTKEIKCDLPSAA
jgi:hypothetical protein